MSLTNAIITGFTGITSNQFAVDTIGNNIANVNTTGFKSSRTMFETLFTRTIEEGTAPSEISGGTNPLQIGYGSGVATSQRSFNQGNVEQTGVETDMAIDGDGFFVLQRPAASPVYTRAGAFTLNTEDLLVAADGSFVQGFSASDDGTIDTGNLGNISIPLGTASEAGATNNVRLVGRLDAGSEVATSGALSISAVQVTADGAAATAATPLTSLVDGNGAPLFNEADVIRISGVQKGGIDVAETQFVVGADGTTYGDLADFLQVEFGIDASDTAIGSPGVTIGDGTIAPAGALAISSNVGDIQAISIDASSIRNSTNGALPFSFTTTPATGEGLSTTMLVFDSLGTPVELRLRTVLESKTDQGTLWRFSVESLDDTAPGTFISDGSLAFDQNGKLVASTGTAVSLVRGGTGAVSPLTFSLDFSAVSSLNDADGVSTLQLSSQDGFPAGRMVGFEVDPDGVITGSFDNGQERVLGQIALATFANNQGLIANSENTFSQGVNSGEAVIGAPLTGKAGRINAGQLELANVDLSRELIALITASTGFSAASRTIRTADDMLQELMLLVR